MTGITDASPDLPYSHALSRFCEDARRKIVTSERPQLTNLKAGSNNHEHENQVGSRDTDGTGNVGAYVCTSPRRYATGRAVGSVSGNRWSVGDLRFAVREIEIGTAG